MDMYALAHGGARPLHAFQAEADEAIQARLGGLLPLYDPASARHALGRCLDFLEQDQGPLTGGQAQLSAAHRNVLAGLRARQK
jgi:hypothetical protein